MKHLGIALALAATVPMGLSSANATAVTVGANYQEGSTRFSTSVPTNTGCFSTNFCRVVFNIVPAGKQLLVTDVSCDASLSSANPIVLVGPKIVTFTGANQRTDRFTALNATITYDLSPSNRVYQVKDATRQLVRAGERPIVELPASTITSITGACSISGRVGNPPD